MSFEKSRGHRGSINFAANLKAFDSEAVPHAARAARREVLDAKKMDLLGLHKPGWNPSTYTSSVFPDRPMQRTLSAFDAPKRSDYNHRSEWLESRSRETFIAKTNKLQVSQREFLSEAHRAHPNLARPPKQRLSEAAIHPKLEGKTGWNVSCEPLASKALDELTRRDLERARASKSADSGRARETLEQREARFLEERRAEKRENAQLRDASDAGQIRALEAPQPHYYHITKEDLFEMSMQVPAKRVTTWSLGSI